MEDDAPSWLGAVRWTLVTQLSRLGGEWVEHGEAIVGPGTTAVEAKSLHDCGPRHVDIGFYLNRNDPDAPVIWDCVSGLGDDAAEAAEFACTLWARTTAPVLWELLTRAGGNADHSHGDATFGLSNWHSLHGPILGYGREDASNLQKWCVDNPVIPLLGHLLSGKGVFQRTSAFLNVVSVGHLALAELLYVNAHRSRTSPNRILPPPPSLFRPPGLPHSS